MRRSNVTDHVCAAMALPASGVYKWEVIGLTATDPVAVFNVDTQKAVP